MNEIKLKPCPFCGGEAFEHNTEKHGIKIWNESFEIGGNTYIECSKCSCSIVGATKNRAIEAWNRRDNE